jgi:diguanylate cyclase (GGDEF)-like protein
MIGRIDTSGETPRLGLPTRVRRWTLWSLNRPALAFVLAVEFTAGVVTLAALARPGWTAHAAVSFGLLLAMSVGYAEAADRVERLKRYLGSDRIWSNHTSVWAVAAALILPTGLAALLVALIYAHVLLMGRRHQSVRPHRIVITAAAMMLATAAASQTVGTIPATQMLHGGFTAAVITVAAVLVFHTVDLVVMLATMSLAVRPPRLAALLPGREVVSFEALTQVLGVVTAEFVLHTPWLTPLVLALVAVLHRSSLIKELQIAATTDSKTSLLNAAAWREQAGRALSRVARDGGQVAVLVIDLDHFKLINDTHGHLAGDRAIRAVAGCLRRELRDHDLVGRFGGEEFVAFLDGRSAGAQVTDVAERLRQRISGLELADGIRVTASIGIAHTSPRGVHALDELLEAADRSLYEAKAAGRNQVRAVHVRSAVGSDVRVE